MCDCTKQMYKFVIMIRQICFIKIKETRAKEYPIILFNRVGNFNELNNDLYRMQLADGDVASRTAFKLTFNGRMETRRE